MGDYERPEGGVLTLKIYIAGKITGDPLYRRKFEMAAKELKQGGNVVLNPAVLPSGLSEADYMRITMAMLDSADTVVLLPDYKDSKGALVEYGYALRVGKRVVRYQDLG